VFIILYEDIKRVKSPTTWTEAHGDSTGSNARPVDLAKPQTVGLGELVQQPLLQDL
jgi:hypothetical protein